MSEETGGEDVYYSSCKLVCCWVVLCAWIEQQYSAGYHIQSTTCNALGRYTCYTGITMGLFLESRESN